MTDEPIPQRLRFYQSDLDRDEGDYSVTELEQPSEDNPANLVSSLCVDGRHRPALDIDVPCEFIPSSTEGHGHLYFPTINLTWENYKRLLTALTQAGIVERAYVLASEKRGQTLLRLPGTKRKNPRGKRKASE
jgi:hypothetical protein